MVSPDRLPRRRLLRAGGLAGLIGIGGAPGVATAGVGHAASASRPGNRSSDRAIPAGDHDHWPAFQFDAENTGFTPDGVGPTERPPERWAVSTQAVQSSPAVVDGTVFLGSDENVVLALAADSGAEQWRFETANAVRSSPAVAGRYVYVGDDDGTLYALDANNGEAFWTRQTEGAIRSSPTVFEDVVYVGTDAGEFLAIQRFGGNVLWSTGESQPIRTTPAVANGRAYYGADDGTVVAVDTESTARQWEFETDAAVRAAPVVDSGTLYVASTDEFLYAVDAETGEKQWQFSVGQPVSNSPVVAGDTIYVASDDGDVFSVDAATAEQNWLFLLSSVTAPPTAIDGTFYVGGTGGTLFAFDAANGELRWNYGVDQPVSTSPVVADGGLFLGTGEGQVLALGAVTTPTPQATPTATPTSTPESTPTPTQIATPTASPLSTTTPPPSETPAPAAGSSSLSDDVSRVLTGTTVLLSAVLVGLVLSLRRRWQDDQDDDGGRRRPTTFGSSTSGGSAGGDSAGGSNPSARGTGTSASNQPTDGSTAAGAAGQSADGPPSDEDDDPYGLDIDREPADREKVDDPVGLANSLVVEGNTARKAGEYAGALDRFEQAFVEYRAIREHVDDDSEPAEKLDERLEKLATIVRNVRATTEALADVTDTLVAAEAQLEDAHETANDGDKQRAKLLYRQAVELYRDAIKDIRTHDLDLSDISVDGQSFESIDDIKARLDKADAGYTGSQ